MNFLTSSVVKAEESDGLRRDPALATSARSATAHPAGDAPASRRASSSSPPTARRAEQRAKYAAYVEAARPADRRAAGPGPAAVRPRPGRHRPTQIAEALYAHAGFREVDEVAFALPFSFEHDDYVQILTDIATRLGPALGWKPRPMTPTGPPPPRATRPRRSRRPRSGQPATGRPTRGPAGGPVVDPDSGAARDRRPDGCDHRRRVVKEWFSRRRIVAAVVVTIGVVLTNL